MLTEAISHFAITVLETTGYAGAALLMALESMIAPIPSEAVMPFVGFLVADGKWNMFEALLATSAGSFIGSYISYLMGYYGGRPFVLKVGKYLLLDVHDLEMTERFFQRKGSSWTLFASRFVPVVRHLVSIPAGIGKMRFWPFAIATTAGATLWNGVLLLCGFKLRENWEMVQSYRHQFDGLIIGMLALTVAWYVWYKLKRRRAMRAGSAE